VILIRNGTDPTAPAVSIAGSDGEQKLSPDELEEQIRTTMEQAIEKKKTKVLIKAEEKVLLGHVARVSSLATSVESVQPFFAVMELDQEGK
jgi:hypothetical protein